MSRSSRARTSAESPAASASSVSRRQSLARLCCPAAVLPGSRKTRLGRPPPRWKRSPETEMSASAPGAGNRPPRAAARLDARPSPLEASVSGCPRQFRVSRGTVVPAGWRYRSPRPSPQASPVRAPAGIATRRIRGRHGIGMRIAVRRVPGLRIDLQEERPGVARQPPDVVVCVHALDTDRPGHANSADHLPRLPLRERDRS